MIDSQTLSNIEQDDRNSFVKEASEETKEQEG